MSRGLNVKHFLSRTYLLSLVLICLCPYEIYCQTSVPPVPIIVELTGGEAPVEFGTIVELKAVVNKGKLPDNLSSIKYHWCVFDDGKLNKNFIVWPDGTQILFPAGTKTHKILVGVSVSCLLQTKEQLKVVDPAGKLIENASITTNTDETTTITQVISSSYMTSSDLTIKEIIVGVPQPPPIPVPNPNPNPSPSPVLPVGRFGLSKIAFTLTEKVLPEHRHFGQSLAASYEKIANKISESMTKQAAGVALLNTDIKLDIQSMIAAVALSNKDVLGASASGWEPWDKAYGDEIFALYKNKKLNGPADFRDAFLETAEGLRQVK